MRLLIVDPGKLTGYGFLVCGTPHKDPTFSGAELPHFDFLANVGSWIRGIDKVVCESFRVNNMTARKVGGDRLWAAEQIGVLRYFCHFAHVDYVEQSPSDAKHFATDAKLKKLGWYAPVNPGEKGHRRDAARHALLWSINNRKMDPKILLP